MDETSNEIVLPVVDLIFRTFPFLLSLPFSLTKKPFYCRTATNAVMNTIQKISVSTVLKWIIIRFNNDSLVSNL